MPLYDYKCKACSHTFEERKPMFGDGKDSTKCPECEGEAERVIIGMPASVLDWRDSDSVHASKRFRPAIQPARR
jgi:putative FmdB family regulatory protein